MVSLQYCTPPKGRTGRNKGLKQDTKGCRSVSLKQSGVSTTGQTHRKLVYKQGWCTFSHAAHASTGKTSPDRSPKGRNSMENTTGFCTLFHPTQWIYQIFIHWPRNSQQQYLCLDSEPVAAAHIVVNLETHVVRHVVLTHIHNRIHRILNSGFEVYGLRVLRLGFPRSPRYLRTSRISQ